MPSRKHAYISDLQSMDTDQRLGSLLFELHFEDAICPAIQKRKSGLEISFGWLTGVSDGVQVALKAIPLSPSYCDEIFAEQLLKNGWKVVWLDFDGDNLSVQNGASGEPIQNVDQFGKSLSEIRHSEPHKVSEEIISFFQSLPENLVERAWRSRSLINGLMKAGVVSHIRDIDAVLFSKDKGLSIIEFKRKLPMRSFFPLPEAIGETGLLANIFTSPEKYETGTPIPGKHYGLDLFSHVRSVESMENAEISFWYLIMKSEKTSPARLFDQKLQPLYTEPFLLSEITTGSFRGITSTSGTHKSKDGQTRDQSGSFNDKKRYQLTIPEDVFEFFRVFDCQR
jgi:hypothetical protein